MSYRKIISTTYKNIITSKKEFISILTKMQTGNDIDPFLCLLKNKNGQIDLRIKNQDYRLYT
ncbi:MAG: hypothetical protein KKA19_08555, partial [Candidatus Margulisbacteria bacterium]|nr:hypothetical protein [Candidatus Margulisiibacteriota bacterium]